jgi:hypothetical protein
MCGKFLIDMDRKDKESKWLETLKVHLKEREAVGADAPILDEYSGEPAFQKYVVTEQARSWDDFLRWVNKLNGWCFRGQREAAWPLTTSLDRSVFRQLRDGHYHLHREPEERELLFRFQQQAHQYLPRIPASEDWCSWFALMQHYGVPTRFVDWTISPYVGMYFALREEPLMRAKRSALWAIDMTWLKEKGTALLLPKIRDLIPDDAKGQAEYVNKIFWTAKTGTILPVNPLQNNERMVAQQGFFLYKLFPEAKFYQVLMSMMILPDLTDYPVIRKLEVKLENRLEFLNRLRTMNIHSSSLFPGLDGFGSFLKLEIEMKGKV